MTADFVSVTEIEGQKISAEQLFRTCHRYHWAAKASIAKDVLEVACGAGQGLGLLNSVAKSVTAGDVSPEVLATAQKTYGSLIPLSTFGAEELPFPDSSFDIVIMFEALYYVPQVDRFFSEARRVLRQDGQILIVSANKDLYDFTASPYSKRYLGVIELRDELSAAGFACQFAALINTREVSLRQRILRPVKLAASKLGLIPKTMHGKEWLKKIFFGDMAVMPSDISKENIQYSEPKSISSDNADLTHKVIYCSAIKLGL
jgi:ubiquinone/menaquinone biosynthesis C-methylase UbiE